MVDTGAGEIGEFEGPAHIVHWDTVDKHLIEVRIPTTDKNGRCAPSLATLYNLHSRYRAKHLEKIRFVRAVELTAVDHADRRPNLGFGHFGPRIRNYNLLA